MLSDNIRYKITVQLLLNYIGATISMKEITVQDLHTLRDTGESHVLLDVREDWEFAIGHVDGSINIPMSAITVSLDSLDRTTKVMCLCHHGMRSEQVAHYLETQGFMDVTNVLGGIDAWSRQVDPSIPTY